MQDLVFLVLTAAFFAVCVGYVRALDRLVGPPDGPPDPLDELSVTTDELAGVQS